jgi:hypothetical protein
MSYSTPHIRPAAVAGMFYPASPGGLIRDLQQMLDRAPSLQPGRPKAIIAPHAGYVYSGPIAASVYAPLASLRASIRRVILLGPTHRVAVDGLAVPSAAASPRRSATSRSTEAIRHRPSPQVVVSDAAHALEHSLEVQLPFLQTVPPSLRWCRCRRPRSAAQVAEVLECLWVAIRR